MPRKPLPPHPDRWTRGFTMLEPDADGIRRHSFDGVVWLTRNARREGDRVVFECQFEKDGWLEEFFGEKK